jgi:hypothetical protein
MPNYLVMTHKSTVARDVQRFFTIESAEHAEKELLYPVRVLREVRRTYAEEDAMLN